MLWWRCPGLRHNPASLFDGDTWLLAPGGYDTAQLQWQLKQDPLRRFICRFVSQCCCRLVKFVYNRSRSLPFSWLRSWSILSSLCANFPKAMSFTLPNCIVMTCRGLVRLQTTADPRNLEKILRAAFLILLSVQSWAWKKEPLCVM